MDRNEIIEDVLLNLKATGGRHIETYIRDKYGPADDNFLKAKEIIIILFDAEIVESDWQVGMKIEKLSAKGIAVVENGGYKKFLETEKAKEKINSEKSQLELVKIRHDVDDLKPAKKRATFAIWFSGVAILLSFLALLFMLLEYLRN